MASVLARAPRRLLIALICMGLGGAACEISSSADDREARVEKLEKIEKRNRQRAEFEREESLVRQAFKSRYEGRIEPDVGCDICPDICGLTDLRAMAVDEFKEAYQQMVSDQFESGGDAERGDPGHGPG